ncbi:hypothetical protein N7499_001417 [Penicillium canescens]|nr:hypothetical protein N7499_001417 [Penicillium canescens]
MPASKGSVTAVSDALLPYRRPRRRPAHLRTKSGCLTCRKRKKKCDETQRTCLNCARQRLECIWQSDRRHCVSGNSCGRESGEATPRVSNIADIDTGLDVVESRSDTKTQLSVSDLISSTQWQALSSLSQTGSIDLGAEQRYFATFGYSSAIMPGSSLLFDFLRARFLPQLIRPAATCRVIDLFSRESLAMAMKTPACMHALLACCGAEIPTKTPRFRNLAKFHYTQAVKELRKDLERDNIKNQWLRSRPRGSAGVEVHLTGAAQLIQLASSYCRINHDSSEIEQAMHRLVYEAFIFHVATSLPFQYHTTYPGEVDLALALAEDNLGRHFNSPFPCYPDSPVLGAPPQLFRCIYTIYRLYQDSSRKEIDHDIFQKLENDLPQWDQPTAAPNACEHDGMEDNLDECDLGPWHQMVRKSKTAVIGPQLYHLGCRILLQRMACSNNRRAHSTIGQLIQEGMDAVQQLQPDIDYFAEYYCWPFYVLGISLQQPIDRGCLMAQILAFSEATNNGTMRRLSEILRIYWKSSRLSLPD